MATWQEEVADFETANGTVHAYYPLIYSATASVLLDDQGPNGYDGTAAADIVAQTGPFSIEDHGAGDSAGDPTGTIPDGVLQDLNTEAAFTIMGWLYIPTGQATCNIFHSQRQDTATGIILYYNSSSTNLALECRPSTTSGAYTQIITSPPVFDTWFFFRVSMDLTGDIFTYRYQTGGTDTDSGAQSFPVSTFAFGTVPTSSVRLYNNAANTADFDGAIAHFTIIAQDMTTLEVDAFAAATAEISEDASDALNALDLADAVLFYQEDASQAFRVQETVFEDFIYILHEYVQAASTIDAAGSTWYPTSMDQITIDDVIRLAIDAVANEVMQVADTPEGLLIRIAHAADVVIAQGLTDNWFDAIALATVAASISDTLEGGWFLVASDGINVTDISSNPLTAYGLLADSAFVSATIEPSLGLTVTAEDTGLITDNLDIIAVIRALADETFNIGDLSIVIIDDTGYYHGYVVNAETGATSTYDNVPFNALAYFKEYGYLLASGESGIYHMDESYDQDYGGLPITAEVMTGMLQFDDTRLKRVISASLGYTAADELIAQIIVGVTNPSTLVHERQEHWYLLSESEGQAQREGIIKIGRGLKSRYWQMKLINRNGGQFSIDTITWHPIVLSRRRSS